MAPDRPGKRNIFDEIAGGRTNDQPGKTPATLYQDVISCTDGNKPAAQRYGNGIQDHEYVGKIRAPHAQLILPAILPILDDDRCLIDSLCDLELNQLIGA